MTCGDVFEESPREGTPVVPVTGHLPVSESSGSVAALHQATSDHPFPQCVVDQWVAQQSDCMDEVSRL